MQAKNIYSQDYCFFSPPEVVRPARDGQIAAITTHSTLLYSETKQPSRKASTFSQSITSAVHAYQAKNIYSHDYWFFSPPEMVRPARNGQIAVITTHSTLLYSETKRPSRKASTCSQSITSPLQIYPSREFLFQLLLLFIAL